MKEEIWVIEFNLDADNYKDHRSWHVETLDNCILSNFDNLTNDRTMDKWIVVGRRPSYEQAKKAQEELLRTLIDKQYY